ncbi:MAG TPA: helix-turn-helix domain-containing protein [Candidatus Nitrosocosmicus sp.]
MEDQRIQYMLEETACKSCPVNNTFNIIGKKFAILILRNMIILKQKRFNEFLDSIERINPKTLSIRLKEMEKDGLINREVFKEKPIRIEYSLTNKGEALKPVLEQMAMFSMKYCCEQIFEDPQSVSLEKLDSDIFEKYKLQV